ncbi:T9SS type A sorting domain-containing protein [Pontibacter kalidii]|uniref:T9SS type A sorting domain-containing protein n=1 Tax=Pontibacter kalidii TaxID=2592049 RepID=UPI002251F31B|nr:T9SS type A sorting domain-containing protein [Pontibacter kalidii]
MKKSFTPVLLSLLLIFLIHAPTVAEGNQSTLVSFNSGWEFLDSDTDIEGKAGNPTDSGHTFSGETYVAQPMLEGSAEGFVSVTPLSPLPIHTSLGDQPQSKVWKYAGKWWAVLPTTDEGTHIWRLDGTTWTKTLLLSDSDFTRADCKVHGENVHILLFRGANLPSQLISVEYESTAGEYTHWSQRSSSVSIPLDPGVETATIDIDGTGRMWLASNGKNNAMVRWSDTPYSTWSAPIAVASGLTDDDICAVVYMPALNKIGLLWSNQNTKRFGFMTHSDGDSPTTWSTDEVPASQSAVESGDGMADDHLNMAVAADGTLYCAVKTGYKTGLPRIALLVRRPTGTWDNLYEVAKAGNRPIVILNEHVGKVKVIYAAPSAGGIYYKEASTSDIQFGSELSLINESSDYATSSKNNYTGEIVLFASTGKQGYSVLASDDTSIVTSHPEETELNKDSLRLMVYPNPFQGKANLSFALPNRGSYSLHIYDAKGNMVEKMKDGTSNPDGKVNLELNWANRAKGLYLIKLITPAGFSTHKVLLTK